LKKSKKKFTVGQIILNALFVLVCLTYIVPFILLLSISFSSEGAIKEYGYTLIPKAFSIEAYKQIFNNPQMLINAYITTIIYSIGGTLIFLFITSLTAYPLSRRNYKLRNFTTWYLFITTLFGGGLVPTYLINTNLLHLDNTIWIYILPGMVSAWTVIIIRTFYQGIPESLVDAAKLDGASEFRIYFQIMLPLSVPVLASFGFMTLVGKWNDWNTSLIYITDTRLFSLQFLLQKVLREAEILNKMAEQGLSTYDIPTETMRYAMAIAVAGPMLFIFPFFQKYFSKGIMIGSIKG